MWHLCPQILYRSHDKSQPSKNPSTLLYISKKYYRQDPQDCAEYPYFTSSAPCGGGWVWQLFGPSATPSLAALRCLALAPQLLPTGEGKQQSRRGHGEGRTRHTPLPEDRADLPNALALQCLTSVLFIFKKYDTFLLLNAVL